MVVERGKNVDPWVVIRHRLNEAKWFKRLRDSRALYIGKRLYQRYMDDDVGMLAAAATYYLILALVPFMIFLFNIILFVAASQIDTVLRYMQYLPGDVPATLAPVVTDIIEQRSTTVLSIGLLLALWSSSKGIDTLIRATDIAFQTGKNVQSYIRIKTKSILFTLLIVGTMLASLGITVFGNLIVKTFMGVLGLTQEFLFFWRIGTYLIPFVAMILVLAVFYRYAPRFVEHEGRTPWSHTLTSAAIVTTIWVAMTAAYGFYVSNIANMGATYGSLVGLMILFIWLNLTSLIFIMGAEFIAAFDDMHLFFAVPRRKDYQTEEFRIV